MSSYLRQPKQVTIRCGICPWVEIYFESKSAIYPAKERARRGLNAHGRLMHRKPHLGDETLAKEESHEPR